MSSYFAANSSGSKPRYRLFVRRDNNHLIQTPTCTGDVTLRSPARHLNYSGKEAEPWKDSGYLSLFRYDAAKHWNAEGTSKGDRAAYSLSSTVSGDYFHFIFVPMAENGNLIGMEQVSLTEETVRDSLERRSGRNYMFDTDQLQPPARVNEETGRVVEYARRICNEYLLAGNLPANTITLTERAKDNSSYTLNLMAHCHSMEDIQRASLESRISSYEAPASGDASSTGGATMDTSNAKE